MEKTKLIGTVIGTSALLTAILCGCCGCDCNKKDSPQDPNETAQIIVIAPSPEELPPCPCKRCQVLKQQIKRMKKSEVLDGAKHHPKVKRDKDQCEGTANCPFKKAAAAAAAAKNGNQNNNGDDVVTESFSIIAVEAVPDTPAAAPAKTAAAAPAKPAAAPQSTAPAAPKAK